MEKEDQRIRLTKRLLKEKLIELLDKKRIDKISVTELCKQAEINRSTFYQHYSTPKDVLLDIEREFSREAVASLRRINPGSTLEERLTQICAFIYQNAAMQKIILKNTSDSDVAQVFSDSGFHIWDISDYLCNDQDMDEISRNLASVFINYGISRVVREWIVNDIPKTPREIAEIICGIMLRKR